MHRNLELGKRIDYSLSRRAEGNLQTTISAEGASQAPRESASIFKNLLHPARPAQARTGLAHVNISLQYSEYKLRVFGLKVNRFGQKIETY